MFKRLKKTDIKPKNEKVVIKKEKPTKKEKDIVEKAIAKSKVKKTAPTKKAAPKTTPKAKPAKKVATPKAVVPKTASGMTKDVMIELNTKTNKWSVRTSGSTKALKTFDTQKEAAEYGKFIAKNNKSEIRVKSKTGKVRASASHRK